jgi:peptidoglycan/xylan/chitin deacetylase (PgdA/CDA1 family)
MATSFWSAAQGCCQRNAARVLFPRPLKIASGRPFISFTFDDFPRSALHTGGAILERFGLRGTYYASLGLMGRTAPTGEIFTRDDATALVRRGHELGCHTFDHRHSWDTNTGVFTRSLIENTSALEALVPGARFNTFSYPISPPWPRTKRVVGSRFACARGGGQTFNAGTADLNYLRAYFLEKALDDPGAIKDVIEQNRAARGWLIFATHDVADSHTPYGCTPALFEDIVVSSLKSGARIVPVTDALNALRALSA